VAAAAPRAEFAAKMHALTGGDHCGYSVRQAGYDLRKLRGNTSSTNPAEPAATTSRPLAARTIAALLTLRDQVIAPILAAVRSPAHGTQTPALDPRRP
jgi:hypothetical protein